MTLFVALTVQCREHGCLHTDLGCLSYILYYKYCKATTLGVGKSIPPALGTYVDQEHWVTGKEKKKLESLVDNHGGAGHRQTKIMRLP